MRKEEIQVGKTYTNGRTKRLVISTTHYPPHSRVISDIPFVNYVYEKPWRGKMTGRMWLPYFAKWAKSEAKEGEDA